MRVGILGGGQLARMLALAGHPLGLEFTVFDPDPSACAAAVADHIVGAFDDNRKLVKFAERVDVVTYEFENVPAESVRFLAERAPVFPSPAALAVSGDRVAEKVLFRKLGIPTPRYAAVDDVEDLKRAVRETDLPAVLKSRTLGYDGKGQAVLREEDECEDAWNRLGGVLCILESFVPFERELSILAVRSRSGDTAFYPVSENTHWNGILRISLCKPADPLQETAEAYARRLLDELEYVGVLALELFDTGGALAANEMAPRVHNTGHWTIEGARTSQFENHLRAILGLPLGETACRAYSAMVNFIGHPPEPESVLTLPGTSLHRYGKAPREGRKIGHATVCAEDETTMMETLGKLRALQER